MQLTTIISDASAEDSLESEIGRNIPKLARIGATFRQTESGDVFLYGRMIGAAAEIDDHLNRGNVPFNAVSIGHPVTHAGRRITSCGVKVVTMVVNSVQVLGHADIIHHDGPASLI
jgi:hypothetical protein